MCLEAINFLNDLLSKLAIKDIQDKYPQYIVYFFDDECYLHYNNDNGILLYSSNFIYLPFKERFELNNINHDDFIKIFLWRNYNFMGQNRIKNDKGLLQGFGKQDNTMKLF